MGRRHKVKLAFMVDKNRRKATYNKRKESLIKMMEELTILCGVDVCAIISCSEFDDKPEFWPSQDGAHLLVSKFRRMPENEQNKRTDSNLSYSEKRVAQLQKDIQKQLRENLEKQMTEVMYDCLAGKKQQLGDFDSEDFDDLGWVIDQTMIDIDGRIAFLKGAGPSQVEATDGNAAGLSVGVPVQSYEGTSVSGAFAGGLLQPYGWSTAVGATAGAPGTSSVAGHMVGVRVQSHEGTSVAGAFAGGLLQPYGWSKAVRPTGGASSTSKSAGAMPGGATQLHGWSNAVEVVSGGSSANHAAEAGGLTQPYACSNSAAALAGRSSTNNAAGVISGGLTQPYGWSNATGAVAGEASTSYAGGDMNTDPYSWNTAVQAIEEGWTELYEWSINAAASSGGSSTSNAAGAMGGGSTKKHY